MKRTLLGLLAVAIAFMIVFAPRPDGAVSRSTSESDPMMVGQMLAPTFDVINVREQGVEDAVPDLRSLLLTGSLTALILGIASRRLYVLERVDLLYAPVLAHLPSGSRAPPPRFV